MLKTRWSGWRIIAAVSENEQYRSRMIMIMHGWLKTYCINRLTGYHDTSCLISVQCFSFPDTIEKYAYTTATSSWLILYRENSCTICCLVIVIVICWWIWKIRRTSLLSRTPQICGSPQAGVLTYLWHDQISDIFSEAVVQSLMKVFDKTAPRFWPVGYVMITIFRKKIGAYYSIYQSSMHDYN